MATAPAKSQPLHYFSLPLLRWGHKNQMNSHHCRRRPSDSNHNSPPPPRRRRSSPSENDSDGGSKNRSLPVGSRTVRYRFSFSSCSSQKHQDAVLEREDNQVDESELKESEGKPWNLRPRKAGARATTEIEGVSKNDEMQEASHAVVAIRAVDQTENLPRSVRLRGFGEGQRSEKKEKRKFWISLSREEIEEDMYAMTGGKPARRPKKRPKNVQKELDNVFPGMYLAGITADDYEVNDR
ncbi:uncharacterized protein LOC132284417 [Cornus florida]|uniref:uncharacterized protein LOC132284417 n=1 Tax=Cornus florida TaxID=4283 RepID=UPI00289D6CB1|nr:uncharacterized protein LOC132284417 [Cornus florida]